MLLLSFLCSPSYYDSSNKGSQEEVSREDPNQKITADLNTVLDKVRLCREMLPQAQAQGGDDLLREVVGFLEACQDRMLELIEAGMAGAEGGAVLSEEVFEQCLRVNDALTRTLEAEKVGVCVSEDRVLVGLCDTYCVVCVR